MYRTQLTAEMASAVAQRKPFKSTHEGTHEGITYSIWYDQGAIPVVTVTSPTGEVLVEELASDKPEILAEVLMLAAS